MTDKPYELTDDEIEDIEDRFALRDTSRYIAHEAQKKLWGYIYKKLSKVRDTHELIRLIEQLDKELT